jgi:peptidoglycan hydrolase-like protein with peptidoglycan-binding domain
VKFPRKSANAEFDRVRAAYLDANQARRDAGSEATARASAVAAALEAVRSAAVDDALDGGTRTAAAQRALDKATQAAANPDPSADPEVHRRVAERRESELHSFVRERYHDVAEELLPHAAQAARGVEDALQAVIVAAETWSAVEARFARLLTLAPGRSAQEVAHPVHATARDEIARVLTIGVNEPLPRAPQYLSGGGNESGNESDDRDTIEAA